MKRIQLWSGHDRPDALVDERIDQLLAELDPRPADPVELRGRQYDLGMAWVHFPEGYGGLNLPPSHQRASTNRLREAGAPADARGTSSGLTMAGPTIVTNGDEAIRSGCCAPFTGEDAWCQLFSEPGAGSDLAGLSCRAVRDGDEWSSPGRRCGTRWPTSPTGACS
jgi:alkylation response protein AidB-like acyl-CoA dehydrogenase